MNYNIKEVNTSEAKFIELINKAKEHVANSKKFTVVIESSASKVPTKTYASNEELAKFRGEEAKKVLVKAFSDNGIPADSYTFKKIKSSVQGPKYNLDPQNKSVYEKYQYVSITLK